MNDNLRAARGILTAIGISLAFWGALAVLALWSYECKAADDWSGTSQALGTVALGATLADWSQTRYIARHADSYRELNPTLPSHPSVGQVDAHFAGGIFLGAVIANWLPEDYRKVFLGSVAVIEVGVVAHNHSIGVQMRF